MKEAAQFFKVLADEARLKILWLLLHHSELCVCDVMAALEITQSKASRHLSTLRHAGLVTDRKEGLWSYYRLQVDRDAPLRRHLELLPQTLDKVASVAPLLNKLSLWLETKKGAGGCGAAQVARAAGKKSGAPRAGAKGAR